MPPPPSSPIPIAVPDRSFLDGCRADGVFTDCYGLTVPGAVGLAALVEAFYTTRLFRLERAVLALALRRPSTDAQARQLAAGTVDTFAAWQVQARSDTEVLLRAGPTRSWLAVAPSATDPGATQLRFGSAVLPARPGGRLGVTFHALVGLHRLYSRLLLAAAARRLRPGSSPHGLPGLSMAALALMALAGLAFWPGYLSRPADAEVHTHVHAVLGIGWLLLLAVQPMLARGRRRSWHRRIGMAGVLVGASFAVSGLLVAHRSVTRMEADQFQRDGPFVYLPLAMAAIFALALGLAVAWRRVPALHARFMSATALPLLDPVLARLLYQFGPALPADVLHQLPAFVLALGVLLAQERSLPPGTRGRRAFQAFAAATAALLLGYVVVPHMAAGAALAAWFRGLPLT